MIKLNKAEYRDKVYACWLGKNIGGTMGTPYEGARQFNDIQGFVTKPNEVLPNDDLDLQLIWLHALEERGPLGVNASVLGEYWMSYIPAKWNEYETGKRNMRIGILPPYSGEYRNDKWKNSNGAWIRTEIWATLAPADPDVACKYAVYDACIDHGMTEGTYAAIFVAALESAAFVESDIRKLIGIGLGRIPKDCVLAKSVKLVFDCYENGVDWKDCRNKILELSRECGMPNDGWFMAPENIAFVILGLLYGECDFKKSMILAINCGDDTDCTGATLGSILGIRGGTAAIPKDWSEYIGDSIVTVAIDVSVLRGVLPKSCTELTDKVVDMMPVVTKLHHSQVRLCDGETKCDKTDLDRLFREDRTIEKRSSCSYDFEFASIKARVTHLDGMDVRPGDVKHVKIELAYMPGIVNDDFVNVRWLLPADDWTVSDELPPIISDSPEYLPSNFETEYPGCTEYTITVGKCTSNVVRAVCEVSVPGRPNVSYVPVTFIV